MPQFTHLKPPADGTPIVRRNGAMIVPDDPIIPFIEGDGTGPDIWRASVRIFDAAVQKAFGGSRRLAWFEVLAGEKAKNLTGEWLPADTLEALRAYKVAIKAANDGHDYLAVRGEADVMIQTDRDHFIVWWPDSSAVIMQGTTIDSMAWAGFGEGVAREADGTVQNRFTSAPGSCRKARAWRPEQRYANPWPRWVSTPHPGSGRAADRGCPWGPRNEHKRSRRLQAKP